MAILQTHIYICLPDRNYVQEDSCLPDQDSVQEDLADTAPLAHDDLGCPIRRDRLYQDTMGATAKPLSGPPVSPSLFRSARTSATERPSPKAIQASIKESATLAAAISMQWKEEVSAMRRELADLRRDLCKELRAFNSNFNTFTQHYNTWSPQGDHMAAGADVGLSRGTGLRPGMGLRPGAGGGIGTVGLGASAPDKGASGAREKKPQVSKVSVGTQARSKVLVRQSTADAAVNCPEEKEEKKNARRNLPKQLSMDPSILACPQSMYVESAIPLSLDPILPGSTRAAEPEPSGLTAVPSKTKADSIAQHRSTESLSDIATAEPANATHVAVPISSETTLESPQDLEAVEQETPIIAQQIEPANKYESNTEASHPDDKKSLYSGVTETCKMQLPYPVPVVTVSPPEEPEYDMSDSDSPEPATVDKTDPVSEDPTTVFFSNEGLENPDPADQTELDSKPSDVPVGFDAPSLDRDPVEPSILEADIGCPSIVVSEYFDPDSPTSPTNSDTNPDPIVTLPDDLPGSLSKEVTSASTLASMSDDTPLCTETEPQDSEWPPLPEPLDATPIYHADLVHFDLVMLTSLDQDDLDSVFMDPEPEPFDLTDDSQSNADDLDTPISQSYSPSSAVPILDPGTLCSSDPSQSASAVCLDPAMEYCLAHMPQDAASDVLLPQVTVTISPPSSVSPDTSLEMDFGPTSPASPDRTPSTPETEAPSGDLPHSESEDVFFRRLGCTSVSQDHVELAEEETLVTLERSSSEQAFLWYRWQRRGQRRISMHRSASVELWSQRYEYNSAEITYVSLTL